MKAAFVSWALLGGLNHVGATHPPGLGPGRPRGRFRGGDNRLAARQLDAGPPGQEPRRPRGSHPGDGLAWGGQPAHRGIQDDNADVRLVAAQHLGEPGPEGERRAAALVGALKDAHAGVRREAAESLCSIGPESAPALYDALTDPDPRVRRGRIGPGRRGRAKQGRVRAQGEAQRILPLLSKLLEDEDDEVRRNAADTLKVLRREAR